MKLLPNHSYPTEWHVGDETYTLKPVRKIPGESADTVGLTDSEKKVIYIKKQLSKAQFFRTLVHELLHAVEIELGVRVRHKEIYKLEKGIADLLLMNF